MNQPYLFLIVLAFLLSSCNPPEQKSQIKIAVASNIQFVMEELKEAFVKETQNTIPVDLIVGSSGQLTAQIVSGAPFDIFLSANMKYPYYLYKHQYASRKPRVYALGKLVIWSCQEIELPQELSELTQNSFSKIAVAEPKNAPYGVAAIKSLKSSKIYDEVQSKIVFGESISQVNQYVSMKSASIGFTAKSVVLSPKLKQKGKWTEVPPHLYSPIKQGILLLNYGSKNHPKEAKHFYSFLFSKKAKTIFKKYGYEIP